MPLIPRIAGVVIIAYFIVFLFAPLLAPYGESEIVGDQYEAWSSQFLLGTDQLGRDFLSRLIYGARNSIGIALATTVLSISLGTMVGIFSACQGRLVDQLISRVLDTFLAIPQLIFALILIAVFGSSIPILICIIGFLESLKVARLMRVSAADIVALDYIEAARIQGESEIWIMLREVLPNMKSIIVAEFGLRFCLVFLLVSALSFLGLGVQPPTADWGSMVRENATLITYGEITPLLPAFAIALLAISVNIVMDWAVGASGGLSDD
ncbi:ABC transporter permease [Ochrobactrum sp. C6C9]|nr:ABC transporter permease [Ochrobactrum sp. C6C9]